MLQVARWLPPTLAFMIAFSLWKVLQLVWPKSPLRHLRGPKGANPILGHMKQIISDPDGKLKEKWLKEYGGTLRIKGFFNRDQLLTMDICAVSHILSPSNDYQKPPAIRQSLAEVFGEGLVVVEGTQHRRQRRIMNPAFGPAQIRELTETFLAKASQLCELWSSEITKDRSATTDGTRVDAVPWLNKIMLDIIGLTGFNHNLSSLDSTGQPNELREAFSTILDVTGDLSIFAILLGMTFPLLRFIPTVESRKMRASKQTMVRIGEELLANAKGAALASETRNRKVKDHGLRGRDLLSLLVKANIATDIPESQRLSDKDVIAQVPTFLFAGHESTSTASAWALYTIARETTIQTKLRDELFSVGTDTPSMDELVALPYLDAVVREILRLYPPFVAISRIATKDDIIPVDKPYLDRYGAARDTVAIAAGDEIIIPILAINRSEELWGPDAHKFMPERWNNVPKAASRIPGVWSNMMTFIGGPRACIGYRFALVELKAILFSLVRAFELELAVPATEVYGRTKMTQRPALRSDPTQQAQLPLLIRPYQRA